MPYSPPSGWVEALRREAEPPGAAPAFSRFHTSKACPRIKDATRLREVDKPYSAVRCGLCASELAQPEDGESAGPSTALTTS